MSTRVVIRGSDVGYSKFCDEGFFKSCDEGLVTSANVMVDGRSGISALEKLRERPWISIEWHRQFWGWPILPKEKVSSLINANGRFKWGHRNYDLLNEVDYDEAFAEIEAELNMCYKITGRYPVTTAGDIDNKVFNVAFKDVMDKYGVPMNVSISPFFQLDEKYRDLNFDVIAINPVSDCKTDEEKREAYDLKNISKYKPVEKIKKIRLDESRKYLISIHPGFVDDIILEESSFTLWRIKDVECACDKQLIEWVRDNEIELCNVDDIINGTHNYQKHLKDINSPLYLGD